MVWCGSKKGHQKDMCLQKIGLHAQNMITNLDSIMNITGEDPYDHLMSTIILNLTMDKILI